MLVFFADDHYDSCPGRYIAGELAEKYQIEFHENDWEPLESGDWEPDCELLILNMIGGSCGQPLPGAGAEKAVRRYCERGGSLLLLHGSSAAFHNWSWWREIVGQRWVRPDDYDGFAPSVHPKKPYTVVPAKCRHELVRRLKPMELPADEIYTELETTCPFMQLLQTHIEEGTFVQAHINRTPWGGKVIGFLPGHDRTVTTNPVLIENFSILIDYLLDK